MSGQGAYDAIVVGLGPAGSSAAAALARGGARVVALERKARPGEPVQCAEFVPAMIGQEVEEIAASARQPIREMLTFVEDDEADLTPEFPGHMISRCDFDRQLANRAAGAGAECRFAVKVQAIDDDGGVTLAGGETLRAPLLIGADGPRSLVGAAIGAANADLVETRQITVPLRQRHLATDIYLSADIPGGYGWLFPKGDVANIGLGVAPAWKRLLKPRLEALHRRLLGEGRVGEEILAHTGGAIPVGGMVGPTGRLGAASVLLAGDAAGLANPVTGAGINSAVISGRLAGEAGLGVLAGEADAACDYGEELADLFAPALARALAHRRRLLGYHGAGRQPTNRQLKDHWIAYPAYWRRPNDPHIDHKEAVS